MVYTKISKFYLPLRGKNKSLSRNELAKREGLSPTTNYNLSLEEHCHVIKRELLFENHNLDNPDPNIYEMDR